MRFLPALRGARRTKELTRGLANSSLTANLGPETKTLLVNYLAAAVPRLTREQDWTIERAVDEGYNRVVWVFKAVEAIAAKAASLPVVVRDGEDEVEDHPLARVMNKQANPMETGQAFRHRLSSQILLSPRGAFVEVSYNNGQQIMRVDLLPPGRTRAIPGDGQDLIKCYEITALDGSRRYLDPDKVRWLRVPHPTDAYAAVTPLEAIGYSIELDHFARLYNVHFLRNDGRPGGIIGVKGGMAETEMNRIEERFGRGPVDAGKLSVIAGDLSYIDPATVPRDMAYATTSATAKLEILAGFGVPESQLGNASGRTFDNASQEGYAFWKLTMLPHLSIIAGGFDADSEDEYETDWDFSDVEELAFPERQRREEGRAEVQAGLRSRRSYAELAGFADEVEDNALNRALWVPAGAQPIPASVDDAAELAALLAAASGGAGGGPGALPGDGGQGPPELPPGEGGGGGGGGGTGVSPGGLGQTSPPEPTVPAPPAPNPPAPAPAPALAARRVAALPPGPSSATTPTTGAKGIGAGPVKTLAIVPRPPAATSLPALVQVKAGGKSCKFCDAPATTRVVHSEGMAFVPACDTHLANAKDAAARCTPDGTEERSNIDAVVPIPADGQKALPGSRRLVAVKAPPLATAVPAAPIRLVATPLARGGDGANAGGVGGLETGWRESRLDERLRERTELAVTAALTSLGGRLTDRTLARLRGPKARKGTRHWVAEHPGDTRYGTKALDVAAVTDPDLWATEAQQVCWPIIRDAALTAAGQVLDDLDWTTDPLAAKALPRPARALLRATAAALAPVLDLIARSARRQADLLITVMDGAEAAGATLDDLATVVRMHGATAPSWAAGLAIQVTTGSLEGVRETLAELAAHGGTLTVDLPAAVAEIIGPDWTRAATEPDQGLTLRVRGEVGRPDDTTAARALPVVREWRSQRDERVRPTHVLADGQRRLPGEKFEVGNAFLAYPGDPAGPPEEVANCFPAETVVSGADVTGGYKRWYSGDMVTVRTASGRILTGTPNHPVLTDRGWVGLGKLDVGDHLVCARVGQAGDSPTELHAPVAPDVEHPPARIDQVVRALAQGGAAQRVPGLSVDFHGDRSDGEVDVVCADRMLRLDGQPALPEHLRQLALTEPDLSLGRGGGSAAQLIDTGATVGDSESSRDLRGGQAVGVELSDVVEVTVRQWSGHVFNLETSNGIYVANGITVHNCRCFLLLRSARGGGSVPSQAKRGRLVAEVKGRSRVRHVRTPEGARKYGEPIGSVITVNPDGTLNVRRPDGTGGVIADPARAAATPRAHQAAPQAPLTPPAGPTRVASDAEINTFLRAGLPGYGGYVAAHGPAGPEQRAAEAAAGHEARRQVAASIEARMSASREHRVSDEALLWPAQLQILADLDAAPADAVIVRRPRVPGTDPAHLSSPMLFEYEVLPAGTPPPAGVEAVSGAQVRTGMRRHAVEQMFATWNAGNLNGPHSGRLRAMHQVAAEEFGGAGVAVPPEPHPQADVEAATELAARREAIAGFLHAQYAETQARFADAGITHVTLHRGVQHDTPPDWAAGLDSGQSRDTELGLRALNSFTVDRSVAADFADRGATGGYLISAQVPADRILSTPRSGMGALGEGEFVVLPGPGTWRVQSRVGGRHDALPPPISPAAPSGPAAPMTDAEYEAHVRDLQVRLAAAKSLATELTYSPDGGKTWNPDRALVHQALLDHMYAQYADAPAERKALIAGGLGGAGKSTTLNNHAGIDTSQYVTINPDEFKDLMAERGLIPQVEGVSPMETATLIHEESSYLASALADRALADGKNIMFDITMSGRGSVDKRLTKLDQHGYGKPQAVFVDIPIDVPDGATDPATDKPISGAVGRALGRHRGGVDRYRAGQGQGGRFVPPEVIRTQAPTGETYSSHNRENFEALRTEGAFSSWKVYDNSVNGRDPVLIASSDDSPEAAGGAAGGAMSPADAKAFIDDHYGHWRANLTPAQDKAVAFYQSPGYALMNGLLRGTPRADMERDAGRVTDADLTRARRAVDDLRAAIDTAPPLTQELTVHRGMSASQFDLTPGAEVTDPGFVSVALTDDAGAASRFGQDAQATIRLPAGTKAAAGTARELILPPGSTFRVLTARTEGDTTHVEMELVPPRPGPGEAAIRPASTPRSLEQFPGTFTDSPAKHQADTETFDTYGQAFLGGLATRTSTLAHAGGGLQHDVNKDDAIEAKKAVVAELAARMADVPAEVVLGGSPERMGLTADRFWSRSGDTGRWESLTAENYVPPADQVGEGQQYLRGDDPALLRELRAQRVRETIGTWARTSNDSDTAALALQQVAADEFGLNDLAYWPSDEGTQRAVDRHAQTHGDYYRAFLRAQYAATQEWLGAQGITEVEAHRGMRWSHQPDIPEWAKADGDRVNVPLRPISSFTVHPTIAGDFANTGTRSDTSPKAIITGTIPAERILGMPRTGVGALGEWEVVVLGGPGQFTVRGQNMPHARTDAQIAAAEPRLLTDEELLQAVALLGPNPTSAADKARRSALIGTLQVRGLSAHIPPTWYHQEEAGRIDLSDPATPEITGEEEAAAAAMPVEQLSTARELAAAIMAEWLAPAPDPDRRRALAEIATSGEVEIVGLNMKAMEDW